MAKVHLFPLITELFSDTRIPLQYLGGSNSPAASQMTLATLLEWIEENISIQNSTSVAVSASTYSYAIPAGKWLVGIAAGSSSAQTFKCGLSAGTDELIYEGIVAGGDTSSFSVLLYGGASGKTIYFSALSGTVTLTFLSL